MRGNPTSPCPTFLDETETNPSDFTHFLRYSSALWILD